MINVNLLGSKPRVKGVADKGDALKTAGVFIGVSILLTVLIVGGLRVWPILFQSDEVVLPQNPITSDTSLKSVQQGEGTSDYSAKALTVDVSVDDPLVSYASMTALEKLNYEFLYSYKLLSELIRIIPPHVDFSLMQVDSFTTLTGQGAVDRHIKGANKEYDPRADINGMLEEFKESPNWSIRPKPATIIRSRGSFYAFDFRVDYTVPVASRKELYITKDDVPLQSRLQQQKESVLSFAKKAGLSPTGSLKRIKANTKGKYKHFYYRFSGEGTFTAVMKFMEALYNKRQPISFDKVSLKAKEDRLSYTFVVKITVL